MSPPPHRFLEETMNKIILTFDPSSSLPKGIAQYPNGSVELFTLNPTVTECTQERIAAFQGTNPIGHHSTWVSYDNRYFALGTFAESIAEIDTIQCAKFEKAAISILAIVGAIGEKLSCSSFDLCLRVLLPYGEINHKSYLKTILEKSLSQFFYIKKEFNVTLHSFYAAPEGVGGILRGGRIQKPLATVERFCLMIGYRNASFIHWKKGGIFRGDTTDLGFHKCVNFVAHQGGIASFPYNQLIPLILSIDPKTAQFKPLCQSSSQDIRRLEVKKIKEAIKFGKADYWETLKSWMISLQIPPVDEVILLGGTACAYRQKIDSHLSTHTVDWRDDIEARVQNTLKASHLSYRLTDLWGFHLALQTNFQKEQQAE